jgi:ankyrin repeat protein
MEIVDAASNGNEDLVKKCIANGADVNGTNYVKEAIRNSMLLILLVDLQRRNPFVNLIINSMTQNTLAPTLKIVYCLKSYLFLNEKENLMGMNASSVFLHNSYSLFTLY